jgi:hypothetical protein
MFKTRHADFVRHADDARRKAKAQEECESVDTLPEYELGLNRAGNALLCYAWGESDRPVFHAAHSLQDVRKFIVEQWLGGEDAEDYDGGNSLARILAQLAKHDWRDDGELVWTFEIGGVKLVDAFEA